MRFFTITCFHRFVKHWSINKILKDEVFLSIDVARKTFAGTVQWPPYSKGFEGSVFPVCYDIIHITSVNVCALQLTQSFRSKIDSELISPCNVIAFWTKQVMRKTKSNTVILWWLIMIFSILRWRELYERCKEILDFERALESGTLHLRRMQNAYKSDRTRIQNSHVKFHSSF